MGNMILCCGLSGSGKTTFCKKFVQEHPNYLHLNVDDFYQVYNGAQVHENEYEVYRAQFVRWFGEFETHSLYWVYADDSTAWSNNYNRSRIIPWELWVKMRSNIQIPSLSIDKEWDNITFVHNTNKETYEMEVIK